MEQQEKANYLIELFYRGCGLHTKAKACALLCVDEIISACEFNNVETYNTDWWNKVKAELEKL